MKLTEPQKLKNNKRRTFGEHLTSIDIFYEYILPHIREHLYEYTWVDLYAGQGNLVLPILESIPRSERIEFFRERIFLFDIQKELVKKAIEKATTYEIPENIAEKNIFQRDTLKDFPKFIIGRKHPVFHITNPPYLYIGYIVKHGGRNLSYFQGANHGYQDLYQIALINDLRNNISKAIYIIPSNFIFGDSCANMARKGFLKFYTIQKAYLFEEKIFQHTGTNVGIFFFQRKKCPRDEEIKFIGVKKKNGTKRVRQYVLKPQNDYHAGNSFNEFVENYKAAKPLNIKFYLTLSDVSNNRGEHSIKVIDANDFRGKFYNTKKIKVSEKLKKEILSNILFVRTIDTGTRDGKAGLYEIKEGFAVRGILASKPFRTHPIQIFLYPNLTNEEQIYLKKYFNTVIEHFRKIDDSEFLTTFKYSETEYTRKYLGLIKVKQLIRTFPILDLTEDIKKQFFSLLDRQDPAKIITYVKKYNKTSGFLFEKS